MNKQTRNDERALSLTPPGADPILVLVSDYGGTCHVIGAGSREKDAEVDASWQEIAKQVIALRASRDELLEALQAFITFASAPPSSSRTKVLKDHCAVARAAISAATGQPS
jgi:hypothetical protein